jgi:hypothetical protein
MNTHLLDYVFFLFSFIIAVNMMVEAYSILVLKMQIIPLPTRVLYGLSVLVMGSEKSEQHFSGKTSPQNLRTYAGYVLIFGLLILISCFVYLSTTILS